MTSPDQPDGTSGGPIEPVTLPALRRPPDPWRFSPERRFGCAGASRGWNRIYDATRPSDLWQPDVYAWARGVAEHIAAREIVDFGCGSGTKLLGELANGPWRIVGVDFKGSLASARQTRSSRAEWVECNLGIRAALERTTQGLGLEGPCLFIVSDVIEHLRDPRALLGTVRGLLLSHPGSRLVLSTPDRARTRGNRSEALPANDCHVREWTLAELGEVLQDSGFAVVTAGFTRANPSDAERKTLLLEVACDPQAFDAYLESAGLQAWRDSQGRVVLAADESACARALQARFLLPHERRFVAPPDSVGERQVAAAVDAGLMGSEIILNGRALSPSAPVNATVTVGLALEDERLDWLVSWAQCVNNLTVDPDEVVVVGAGCRRWYRREAHRRLSAVLRAPLRIVSPARGGPTAALDLALHEARTRYLAWTGGTSRVLGDFLAHTLYLLESDLGLGEATTLGEWAERDEDWRADRAGRETVADDDEDGGQPRLLRRQRAGSNRRRGVVPVVGYVLQRRAGGPGDVEPFPGWLRTLRTETRRFLGLVRRAVTSRGATLLAGSPPTDPRRR